MKNLPICILIALFIVLGLMLTLRENFSNSGMTISDDYCTKLATVYFDPENTNQEYRNVYGNKICGNIRRGEIYPRTGNYFTDDGVLV
jgi:hypothetical protein